MTSSGPIPSHLSTLLSSGSAQGQYISVEIPKVTSRHFQCPEETKRRIPVLTFLLRVRKIFPRSLSYPTSPLALRINWAELGHKVHAEPLIGDIIGYRLACSNLEWDRRTSTMTAGMTLVGQIIPMFLDNSGRGHRATTHSTIPTELL